MYNWNHFLKGPKAPAPTKEVWREAFQKEVEQPNGLSAVSISYSCRAKWAFFNKSDKPRNPFYPMQKQFFSNDMITSLSVHPPAGRTAPTRPKLICEEATGFVSMTETHNKGMINMTRPDWEPAAVQIHCFNKMSAQSFCLNRTQRQHILWRMLLLLVAANIPGFNTCASKNATFGWRWIGHCYHSHYNRCQRAWWRWIVCCF